ncbi:hypothetical protein [Demequina litorisediminis]|uniref:hypothetical protein n=1 Tax=Demequina litorisediminis TaxID=1849022 RepID=UPI0024E0B39B|nr:hypothetical protein [Demequina litorisediminis]
MALDGATVMGDIFAFTTPTTEVARVMFWVDNTAMTGTPTRNEGYGPFDLGGGAWNAADPYNVDALGLGEHTVTARIIGVDGDEVVVTSTFTVGDAATPNLNATPSAMSFTLAASADPASQIATVTTSDASTASATATSTAAWLTATEPRRRRRHPVHGHGRSFRACLGRLPGHGPVRAGWLQRHRHAGHPRRDARGLVHLLHQRLEPAEPRGRRAARWRERRGRHLRFHDTRGGRLAGVVLP